MIPRDRRTTEFILVFSILLKPRLYLINPCNYEVGVFNTWPVFQQAPAILEQ